MGTVSGNTVAVDVDGRTLRLSNLDKVLYPEVGLTKGEVITYYTRNDNVLTVTWIVYDPLYLTEPYIKSRNFYYDPGVVIPPYPCSIAVEIPRPEGVIPHYLPGTNPSLSEWAAKNHLPLEGARGGAETMYPEFRRR